MCRYNQHCMKKIFEFVFIIFVIAIVLSVHGCSPSIIQTSSQIAFMEEIPAPGLVIEHLVMGNPSAAVFDTSCPANYLMEKHQYVLSYNRDRGIPNWIAWHLDSTWLGTAPRQDDFRRDTLLPDGWYQVNSTSYQRSGYARGHHCPSADRTNTIENNSATFLMTNMMPQVADNNSGPWEKLEEYCRELIVKGKELYMYAGGADSLEMINNGHIVIPAKTWKVILVLDAGENDISRVTDSTRTIAVVMPNSADLIEKKDNWKKFCTSVDSVEILTGYNFFSNLPNSIQTAIECAVDSL
jgi:endonuclease G, mitochondrial